VRAAAVIEPCVVLIPQRQCRQTLPQSQNEMARAMGSNTLNQALLDEVQKLREENERLRARF